MPTHANAMDDAGAAAFGGRFCIVNKIGMCWHGVGLPGYIWLIRIHLDLSAGPANWLYIAIGMQLSILDSRYSQIAGYLSMT